MAKILKDVQPSCSRVDIELLPYAGSCQQSFCMTFGISFRNE